MSTSTPNTNGCSEKRKSVGEYCSVDDNNGGSSINKKARQQQQHENGNTNSELQALVLSLQVR